MHARELRQLRWPAAAAGLDAFARLRHLVAAHLSERNNRPELARHGLAAALEWEAEQIVVADPLAGTEWIDV